ncbi:MAG: polysaccharide deacetylase family protein [Acidimicrobiia bacterium]|nr:polysaccharide deacetylase family protein [Acidimicrobiia bacterium]
MPAERTYGMDHPHYEWSPLPARPVLRWPDGAQLALGALVLLEHYEWAPPEGSYSLRRPSGGLIQLPFPDYVRLTHREYGHRVGIFRVLDTLAGHGVPATVAIDSMTVERYPWLAAHCAERGCELVGHGVAASRLITSRMDEEEERATIAAGVEAVRSVTGAPPAGWFSPEGVESPRTPQLVAEAGLRYLCDWPNDEQPYPMTVAQGELTNLPLFLEVDDEFALWHRRLTPQRWARLVVDVARGLYEDGATSGRLLVLTLRPWLVGQPFRILALKEALGEITSWPGVWPASGREIVESYRAATAARPG